MNGTFERRVTDWSILWILLALTTTGCDEWSGWLPQGGGQEPGVGSGGDGAPLPTPTVDPTPPEPSRECPPLAAGSVEVLGVPVQLWLGDPKANPGGPIVIYWHGTGSSPSEAQRMLGDAFDEIQAQGGMIAALGASTGKGTETFAGSWSTGDLAVVDELLGCALEQYPLDERRIYTAGCSGGGVQAGVMAILRSSYVAAAALNSGGTVNEFEPQDPSHPVPTLTTHGTADGDHVFVNFAEASLLYASTLAARGGLAIDCDHGGGHCGMPDAFKGAQWRFLEDHSFGVTPEPYASDLPEEFPDYCQIITP